MRSVVEPQIEQVNQKKPLTKYEQGCFLAKFFPRNEPSLCLKDRTWQKDSGLLSGCATSYWLVGYWLAVKKLHFVEERRHVNFLFNHYVRELETPIVGFYLDL